MPRMTVNVVPDTPVTSMYSASTRTRKLPLVGNPPGTPGVPTEETLIVVAPVVVTGALSVVCALLANCSDLSAALRHGVLHMHCCGSTAFSWNAYPGTTPAGTVIAGATSYVPGTFTSVVYAAVAMAFVVPV